MSFPSWSETLTMDDLVERNDLHYKQFTNVPFTWEISGKQNGSEKKGKKNGEWLSYGENGQLMVIGNYKDGKQDGLWELFNENGSLNKSETFKDGVKVSDWPNTPHPKLTVVFCRSVHWNIENNKLPYLTATFNN